MTLWPALLCHFIYSCALRCASLLVPQTQRSEWWMEWRSELWHVRQACTAKHGISWATEREVAAFCLGAFQDASSLRESLKRGRVSRAAIAGSATQCLRSLIGLAAIGYGVALLLPGVSAVLHPSHYRDARNLMLIRDGHSTADSMPTISTAQYRLWERRRQDIFDSFAFYHVIQAPIAGALHTHAARGVAIASSNLFDLLGVPVHQTTDKTRSEMPQLILSDEMWRREFGGDSDVFGRVVRVGQQQGVVTGVAPAGSWRLPGKVDAWLLKSDADVVSKSTKGYVVGHLKASSVHTQWGESWHMSAPTPDGPPDDFFCTSLTERSRGSGDIFLFAVILACLALPATTSLPLGEYRLSSRKMAWSKRLRRWGFLGCKIALLLPIVYFVSIDLAHIRLGIDPFTSEYIQLVSSFSICLFGLRWSLRDQRQRCPVCLRKLTHPARVGEPSRTFLAWNGMELMCAGGHGLLHVPEMPTSWFSTQRWLYLDPSWEVLFAEPALASAGYF
jgi:hypothetical protein